MAKKSVFGDALDSIFDDLGDFGGDSGSNGLQAMLIGEIEPNREQPRKDFDPDKLNELAESIRLHGLIQPITVRELQGGAGYQIVAGERRWRAARIAGLEEVPVRVMELTDAQTMQIAMIENVQREDLNPVEEANGYQELIDRYQMTQEQIAGVVSKPRSSVANSLRLLTLPDEVLNLVRSNQLPMGHCKVIMSVQSTAERIRLAKKVASEGLSVRETEDLVKLEKDTPDNQKQQKAQQKNAFFREAELALAESLNTAVRIVDGKNKKTLCIDFTDEEELKQIIKKF